MKILLCSNTFEHIHHGPAKFANIILEINDKYPEHEIRILTEDVSKPTPYVHKVNLKIPAFLHVFSQIFRMFVYHRHAVKMHSRFSYDVIVYNNSFLGLWSAIASDRPTVGMINDYSHLDVGLFNFKPEREWIKKFFFKQLERWSVRRHLLILTNSDYLQNRVIQQYKANDRKVFRLYKAIQLKTTFLKNRIFSEPIKILFVKADYLTGGLDVLANSLKWLLDYRFQITIIGPSEEFKTYIMSYFENVSNAEIVFLGTQPQSIVYEHMDTSDIFCVPSRREALGVANIEALNSGISVITTNVGGVPEVMDYGRNGWLVNPEAPHELAAAIQECIEDCVKRQALSSNGLTFIRKFSKENMIDNFIRLLTEKITC